MISELYSERLLTLAANLPHSGVLVEPQASVERTAKLCGSRVRVDLDVDNGVVTRFAQDVQACALGQASAAVLGAGVIGARPDELVTARDMLRSMLKSGGPAPTGRFEGLAVLGSVAAYPARHASILLAFEAAAEACAIADRSTIG